MIIEYVPTSNILIRWNFFGIIGKGSFKKLVAMRG